MKYSRAQKLRDQLKYGALSVPPHSVTSWYLESASAFARSSRKCQQNTVLILDLVQPRVTLSLCATTPSASVSLSQLMPLAIASSNCTGSGAFDAQPHHALGKRSCYASTQPFSCRTNERRSCVMCPASLRNRAFTEPELTPERRSRGSNSYPLEWTS